MSKLVGFVPGKPWFFLERPDRLFVVDRTSLAVVRELMWEPIVTVAAPR